MKKTIVYIMMAVVMVLVNVGSLKSEAEAKSSKGNIIQVRGDGNCDKPCVVLGRVDRFKHTVIGTCSKKLGKFAKKQYGADAVLKYKTKPAGEGAQLICEGIAVRWSKEGETGISKITDETLIPILEK